MFDAAALAAALDLRTTARDRFVGACPDVGWARIFGGLVVAQALVAAERSVTGRVPHSLHSYFLRPGDPAAPIAYEVERLRDGGSFSVRRCVARQHGVPIFVMSASFQREEDGFVHQFARPEAPPPDSLPSEADLLARFGALMPGPLRAYLARPRPVEIRAVDPSRFMPGAPPAAPEATQRFWVRVPGLRGDAALHRAALAYLSDMTLLDSALAPHGRTVFDPHLQAASLDHALWLHGPVAADQWLLYTQDSPAAAGGRGLARGLFHTEEGFLIASVAQEGLIRPREMPKK